MTPFAMKRLLGYFVASERGTCRKCLEDGGVVDVVHMDLSKAFDCLPYDLLIAKLEAYGFGMKYLKFIHCYLSGRKQRVKIWSSFTEWLDIVSGLPQGSDMGP